MKKDYEKVGLIMGIRVISVILCFFLSQNCEAQNLNRDTGKICLDIKFGEFFKNDKVDLAINDTIILKKAILTTGKSYGLTNIWVTVTRREGKYFVSTSESNAETTVDLYPDIIQIDLRYHRKKIKFEIKKSNGTYVVFDTDRNGKMTYKQTIRRPFFD